MSSDPNQTPPGATEAQQIEAIRLASLQQPVPPQPVGVLPTSPQPAFNLQPPPPVVAPVLQAPPNQVQTGVPLAPPAAPVPTVPHAPPPNVPAADVPQVPVSTAKMTLGDLLNKIKCHNITLTDGIGLGDALDRLATAISRSGVKFDDNGNPTVKGVNKGVGKILQDALGRIPRTVDYAATSLGYDPARPMFMEGEAYSVPIHSEMVILLPKDKPAPIFPDTDMDSDASPA